MLTVLRNRRIERCLFVTYLSSLGWLRLLHQCLSVSTLNSNLAVKVLNSAASVEGLVEACCNLLLLPAPSLFTPNLERVLLQLGLHSRELGLRLIGLLLNNRSTPFFQGIAFLPGIIPSSSGRRTLLSARVTNNLPH